MKSTAITEIQFYSKSPRQDKKIRKIIWYHEMNLTKDI